MMQHEDILTTEKTERVDLKPNFREDIFISSYSGQCSDGTYHFHRSLTSDRHKREKRITFFFCVNIDATCFNFFKYHLFLLLSLNRS